MNIYTDKNTIAKTKRMYIIGLVMINIIFFIFAGANLGSMKTLSTIKGYTKDWDQVDVVIDDVSFEKDGSDTDDGITKYKFVMNRILKYTYKGKNYEVKNQRNYESRSKNYQVDLKKGYTDEYTYKVNPAHPSSVSSSYSQVSGSILNIFKIIRKVAVVVFIAIPLVIDIVVLVKFIKRKRNVFDSEE